MLKLSIKFSPSDVVLRDEAVGLLLRLPKIDELNQFDLGTQWDVSISTPLGMDQVRCVIELPRVSGAFRRNQPVLHVPAEWGAFIDFDQEITLVLLGRRDPAEKLEISRD